MLELDDTARICMLSNMKVIPIQSFILDEIPGCAMCTNCEDA